MRTRYLFAESLGVFGGSLAFTGLGLLLGLEGTTWTLALLAALPYLTLPLDLLAGLLLDRLDRRTLLLAGVWLRAGILGLFALLPKEPLFLLPAPFLLLGGFRLREAFLAALLLAYPFTLMIAGTEIARSAHLLDERAALVLLLAAALSSLLFPWAAKMLLRFLR